MTATLGRPAKQDWPRTTRCAHCDGEVLLARHRGAGRPARLDPLPVLPEGPCGVCHNTGSAALASEGRRGAYRISPEPGDLVGVTRQVKGACPACHGTRRRGEPLTAAHVIVDPSGIARRYDGHRDTWEAAYRRHECASGSDKLPR
jgi:hypothetical protein